MQQLKTYLYNLLRWSEKYTKTDMVYVGKSGFWLAVHQGIATIISFVLSILFAKYVSRDAFGIYKYILSVAGFVSAFSLSGMNTAIVRAVSQGRDGTFARSLPLQLRWTAGQFLVNASISGYYFFNGNTPYSIAFAIIAIFGPISTITNSFGSYLQGKQNFRTYSLYSIYSSSVYFVVIAAVTMFSPSFLYLVAAYFLSTALGNTYFCFRTLKKFPARNKELRTEDVQYAKRLSLMTIVGSAANQIDSIIVYQLLGPTQLAVYAFSTLVPDRLRGILGVLTSTALPKLAEKSTITAESMLRKQVVLALLAVMVIVIYIVSAPYLYYYLFNNYLEAVWYSQVYALSLLALPSLITVPSLYAQRNERALVAINVGLPLIKLAISFGAIALWDILGAIIAKLIHYLLSALLSGYFVKSPNLAS